MHIQTVHVEAGSSDKGWGYAKWYLGVTSPHFEREPSSTLHLDAEKMTVQLFG